MSETMGSDTIHLSRVVEWRETRDSKLRRLKMSYPPVSVKITALVPGLQSIRPNAEMICAYF